MGFSTVVAGSVARHSREWPLSQAKAHGTAHTETTRLGPAQERFYSGRCLSVLFEAVVLVPPLLLRPPFASCSRVEHGKFRRVLVVVVVVVVVIVVLVVVIVAARLLRCSTDERW